MTLTQSYGVPYFGTHSKVVDFFSEFALLAAGDKALCKIRKEKNPLSQRFCGMLNFLLLLIILSPQKWFVKT